MIRSTCTSPLAADSLLTCRHTATAKQYNQSKVEGILPNVGLVSGMQGRLRTKIQMYLAHLCPRSDIRESDNKATVLIVPRSNNILLGGYICFSKNMFPIVLG